MISIIPALDIMKTITDKNIEGDSATYRRMAFDVATDLMSMDGFDVILEGNLYEKISVRLNADHKAFFESVYTINNAAKDVPSYDVVKSVVWVSESETKTSNVMILSDSPADYTPKKEGIVVCSPQEFILTVQRAKYAHKRKEFSSIHDALNAILFFGKGGTCSPKEPQEETATEETSEGG